MELTLLQKTAVQDILNLYFPNKKNLCEFKSPTGSGKTFMASYFIAEMIQNYPNEKFIFVIATPSSSSLPLFFEQKLNKYKVDLPYTNFEVEYVKSPSSQAKEKCESIAKIIPQQNKIYIFGKSSFGRGRIFSEYGIIDDFVLSAVDRGFKLIYIRDEAHIGGDSIDRGELARNFEKLMTDNADFVLKMTATPNGNVQNRVVLQEKDLNNPLLNEDRWLLKTNQVSLLNKSLDNAEILANAIERFRQIKNDYKKLDIVIRPAMLIQVDNDSSTNNEIAQKFKQNLENIKKELNNAGLAWVQYFGDGKKDSNRVYEDNFSLEEITDNNNDIDVIIFKVGPSTGWDIPRACMLVQLRDVCSLNLNVQTLGRIKRNPYYNLQKNLITDNYFVYSNHSMEENDFPPFNLKVQDKFDNESFLRICIENKSEIKKEIDVNFCNKINSFLNDNRFAIQQKLNATFVDIMVNGINKFVYKKVLKNENGKEIYSCVSNPFVFLRDYKRLIGTNDNQIIYKLIAPEVKKICEQINEKNEEFVYTILLNDYKRQILDIIYKNRKYQPKYKIVEQKYNPKIYNLFNDTDKLEKISKRNYLFDIENSNNNRNGRQPLDSNPEVFVFNKIFDFIDETDCVELWAKNLTTSNIFGEYLDELNNLRYSYFDFIIKYKNGIYLYIEVKGEKDINPYKTMMLQKAYADYFSNLKEDLFIKKLVISVWKVDEKGKIIATSYYNNKDFKQELNVLNVEDLLQKLGARDK